MSNQPDATIEQPRARGVISRARTETGFLAAEPCDPGSKWPHVRLLVGRSAVIRIPVDDTAALNAFLGQLRDAIIEVRGRVTE